MDFLFTRIDYRIASRVIFSCSTTVAIYLYIRKPHRRDIIQGHAMGVVKPSSSARLPSPKSTYLKSPANTSKRKEGVSEMLPRDL